MGNNIIIKGFNTTRKLVTQGLAHLWSGMFVKITSLSDKPVIAQSTTTKHVVEQSINTEGGL